MKQNSAFSIQHPIAIGSAFSKGLTTKFRTSISWISFLFFLFLSIHSSMAQTLSVTLNASNIGCNSYRTGSIHATVSGGVPPYHFRWSNDAGKHLGFGMTNGGWYFIKSGNNLGNADGSDTKYCAYLSENGIFTCRRLQVHLNNGWSDHVFESNYELKTLSQVENYIHENKHLPEIPSASELKEKGIDTEEMFALQMKKIEELTLYTIQLQKQLDILSKELKTIKK